MDMESMHGDAAVWGPRLERSLRSQRELCERLEALSREQTALIGAEDTDGLLRVLAERQTVVDQLAAVGAEIEPFRREWESLVPRLPRELRETLSGLVREIGALVETIGRRDDADRATLEKRRTAIAQELGGINRGRGAIAAYGGHAAGRPMAQYQDRQG